MHVPAISLVTCAPMRSIEDQVGKPEHRPGPRQALFGALKDRGQGIWEDLEAKQGLQTAKDEETETFQAWGRFI